MLKTVDRQFMNQLTETAKASPRRRTHYNFHQNLEDQFHRLCIAAEPGTYIRTHRHFETQKWELFVILRGAVTVFSFDDNGVITQKSILRAGGDCPAIEIPCEQWHGFISLETGTIILEAKPGPYVSPSENDSAAWAPKEGNDEAIELEKWLHTANIGETWRGKS